MIGNNSSNVLIERIAQFSCSVNRGNSVSHVTLTSKALFVLGVPALHR